MRRIVALSLVLTAVVVAAAVLLSSRAAPHAELFQPGQLWVRLRADVTEADLTRVRTELGSEGLKIATTVRAFPQVGAQSALSRVYRFSFAQPESAALAVAPLIRTGIFDYAEQIPLAQSALVPNDPSYASQDYLRAVNAEAAWDALDGGCTATIAIVDDAVELTHPDLSAAIFENAAETAQNGIDDDQNGRIDDVTGFDVAMGDPAVAPPDSRYSHGTQVAGLAAATADNAAGIAGMGRGCKVLPVKVASDTTPVISRGYEGIVYAAELGAKVINCSWSTPVSTATGQAVVEYALSRGAVIVAAAGNTGDSTAMYPASYPGVISVAAVDAQKRKLPSSSFRTDVTLSAPGDALLTTGLDGGYERMSGTSAGSALVSGVVAMMASKHPGIPADGISACLRSTATNLDAENPDYVGKLGAGLLNAAGAMSCAQAALSQKPAPLFDQDRTQIVAGGTVNFVDRSTYSPTSWQWSFPGGSPSSFTGRSPPAVSYPNTGTFDVTLTVSNGNGSNSHTQTGAVVVSAAPNSTCTSLNLPQPAGWTQNNYFTGTNGADGWINGTNIYQDKQKAMFFDVSASAATRLTQVLIAFHAPEGAATLTVPVRVYDGTSGAPGTMLGERVLTLGQIQTDVASGNYTLVKFLPVITLPSSKKFFVSVVLSNLSWTRFPRESLAIVSNANGQTSPSAVWEQQSDNGWYQYATAGSWNLNVSLYIHPFLTNAAPMATLAVSDSSVCSGDQVDFDATGTAEPGTVLLDAPGGTPSSFSNVLQASAFYFTPGTYNATLSVQSSCGDTAFFVKPITVAPSPTVDVFASAVSVCAGTSVTLNASGLDSYTWSPATDLSATTGAVVTAVPTAPRTYTVTGMKGSCPGSATIELEVTPVVTPAVTISVADGGVLTDGVPATLIATAQNAGTQPTYQWKKNGAPVGTNSASFTETAPVAGDQFTCKLVSDAPCTTTSTATSNTLIVAAAPVADAGVESDAGVEPQPEPVGLEGSGCGCSAAEGLSATWLLAFALVAAKRRSRKR